MIFKKITRIKTAFLFLAASTCTSSSPVQIDAVARYANTTGTSLIDSLVKINNSGSMSGLYNLALGNDITAVSNIHMTGGNITGVNDIQMSGDLYGANDLNFTGDIVAEGDLYMQGNLYGVENIHMNGGNITGANDITANNIDVAGSINGVTNISMDGTGDLSGVTNISMTEGGNITGAVNIEMTGDITGANNLIMTGTISGVADITMNGNISNVTNITMAGGDLTGAQNIQLTNDLDVGNSITVGQNVTIGDDLTVSGTLFINEIANLDTGVGVLWPTNAGSVGQFLGIISDGALGYDTPTGAGNVSAANVFTTDDKIIVSALNDGARNIKETGITLDTSNNISGVATLGATTVNATTVGAQTINAARINASTIFATSGVGTVTANTVYATTVVAPNLTGLASLNLPLTGGTLTNNLNLATQSALNFQDLAGGEFVGLRAPATIGTSYTIELPETAPAVGQFLQALSPSATTWGNVGGAPALGKTFYVAKNGSDSNDGSISAPFEHISYAVSVASELIPAPNQFTNPITISIGAGSFTENRINIDVNGLSIKGSVEHGTIIKPANPGSENLIEITKPYVELSNFTLQATPGTSSYSAINMIIGSYGRARFNQIGCVFFNTGISLQNTTTSAIPIFMENLQFAHNITNLSITNGQIILSNSYFNGPYKPSLNPPGNTGITMTGSYCKTYIYNSYFNYFNDAIKVIGGAQAFLSGLTIQNTLNSIQCSGGSSTKIMSSSFLSNYPTSINLTVNNSKVYLEGCIFDCENVEDENVGTAISLINNSTVISNACTIKKAKIGIVCGTQGDTLSDLSAIEATGFSIIETTTNIQQYGAGDIHYVGGSFDATTVHAENPSYLNISGFNNENQSTLALGNTSNAPQRVYEVLNGTSNLPNLSYNPNYYGHQGTVYQDPSGAPVFNATKSTGNNARVGVITTDNTKETSFRLFSDTSGGSSGTNIRGWFLRKTGTDADLAFTYTDNDQTLPENERGPYDSMRLNGRDNRVEFPIATGTPPSVPTYDTAQLLWGNDTNLYRSAANTLQTDGNFIVGTNPSAKLQVNSLAPNSAVITNASNQLESSTTTTIELGYLSGVTSSVQTQLTGKVDRAGDTMTGALTLPAGTTTNPSLKFTGGTNTGISMPSADSLSFDTLGAERLNIAASGALAAYAPLNLATQNPLRFQNLADTNFIGLRAPTTIGTSYTVDLPNTKPFAGQFLQAMSDSTLTWTTIGGLPHDSLAFYVAFNGNDANDGSFAYPFATVKHAVEIANIEALRANPVIINIGPGEFYEDNSDGPFLISNNRISLVGASIGSTLLYAESASQDFFRITTPDAEFSDLTLMGPDNSTASAISYESNSFGYNRFSSIAIAFFGTGLKLRSGTPSVTLVLIDNLQCTANGTCIDVDGVQVAVRNSLLQGSLNTPVYTGIRVSGSGTLVALLSNYLSFFNTAITVDGGSARVVGCNIESSNNSVVCTGGSTKVVGSSFLLSNATTVHLTASGAGTQLTAVGCQLQCTDADGITPRGTGVKVIREATAILDSCDIQQAVVGIQCGQADDLSNTIVRASGVSLVNCTTDIQQNGSATVQFIGGSYTSNLSINDPTNVAIASFNNNEGHMCFGNASDTPSPIYCIENGQDPSPVLTYENNYYGGYKGTVYKNLDNNPTFNATQAQSNHARYYVITNDKTKEAGIHLVSDADPVGDASNVRGWSITKTGTSAELAFAYVNTDDGQLDRGPYNVMQLDGFNNIMQFPVATDINVANTTMHLEWAGDTQLYRSGDATLTIDNNLIISGLNAAGIVHNNANGLLSTSNIVDNDIADTAAIADTKLAQITTFGKVANSATTATNSNSNNTIVARDGSGDFSANIISAVTRFSGALTGNVTGSLFGNAATATSASTFSTALSGNVTGGANGGTTTVETVGGKSAADIATSVNATQGASSSATTGAALVKRNGSGGFGAGIITATQFSGPLSGAVTGDVTGRLFGTADYATYATTSTNFTGLLAGDVTGLQGSTVVALVNGQSAATISAGALLANAATHLDTDDALVKRDDTGNFATNMITLNGLVNNPTDATTKQYVDDAVTGGLVPKTPVLVTSISDTALTGTGAGHAAIDGVILSDNDRVLLTAQTNQIDNGIWLSLASTWTRPTDFANGSVAQGAYVLTDSGTNRVGTGWLSSTPLAIIGTDTVSFVQFSSAGQTTAANIGTGIGKIFKEKIGTILYLKTLAGSSVVPAATGNFVTITNNTNELTFAVTATSDPTVNTLVARDSSGNFSASTVTANLTGAASLNVRNDIDSSMFANLTMASAAGDRHQINWQDNAGSNVVGLRAPALLDSSYTMAWPATAPTAGQYLQALSVLGSDATLTWTSGGGSPTATKTIYVSTSGSPSNDGSMEAPLSTVKDAVTLASSIAAYDNPVVIQVGPGFFVEENPINIEVAGITIKGSSLTSTYLMPLHPLDHLFSITTPFIELTNFSLDATDIGYGASDASAINLTLDVAGYPVLNDISTSQFKTGISASSTTGLPVVIINNILSSGNMTAISISGIQAVIKNSLFQGPFVLGAPATNNGIIVDGPQANVALLGDFYSSFTTAVSISNGAHVRAVGGNIENSINGFNCTGGKTQLLGLNFILNVPTSINVAASGSGTHALIEGCLFDGDDANQVRQGTAVLATTGAVITVNSCTIEETVVGIKCSGNDTVIEASGLNIIETVTCIQQRDTSTLKFVGGTFEVATVDIENPENVSFSAFNSNGSTNLATGNAKDTTSSIVYEILNGQEALGLPSLPRLSYEPNYYGHKGTVYKNPNDNPTFNATQSDLNDARYYVATGNNEKEAGISLISDSNIPGALGNVKGWSITKAGTSADLTFSYIDENSGPIARGPYTLMKLNGEQNLIEFPLATGVSPTFTSAHLVWAGDTNLYRVADATLKTDGSLVVGGLATRVPVTAETEGRVVHNNGTGLLSSSYITNNDIIAAAGINDTKLATISTPLKVSNSATTATNLNTLDAIVKRNLTDGGFLAGPISATSFTGPLYGNANTATSATTAGSATSFSGPLQGDVTGNQATTVVSFVGAQSAAYVAAGAVLANTATKDNTFNTIVKRGATGEFSAGTITATLNGNATSATSAITSTTSTYFTGSLAGDVMGTQAATIVALIGGQTATSVASTVTTVNAATNLNTAHQIVRRDVNGDFAARNITATNFTGLASNATSAVTSTTFLGSFLGNVIGTQNATVVASVGGQTATNVAAGAVLANAATSANTFDAIVRRAPVTGNFSAGTITANLTGLASNATIANTFSGSLTGDVVSTGMATTVNTVGGSSAENIDSATVLANAATSANTLNQIVKRDGSGNFIAGTITASLTGAASLNVRNDIDSTMAGRLTLPAGTIANPSLKFTGGTNTGISSPVVNTLSFDTNGAERMNINATGVVSIPGSLTLAPGTAATPSFNFSNGTTTGISSATADTLSFDVSGVEKMSMDATSITAATTFIVGTLMAKQAIQSVTYIANTNVAINDTTSILVLNGTGNRTITFTQFPQNPVNGQLLTIMVTTAVTATLAYGALPVTTPITSLTGTATGLPAVTYMYLTTDGPTPNTWCKYSR